MNYWEMWDVYSAIMRCPLKFKGYISKYMLFLFSVMHKMNLTSGNKSNQSGGNKIKENKTWIRHLRSLYRFRHVLTTKLVASFDSPCSRSFHSFFLLFFISFCNLWLNYAEKCNKKFSRNTDFTIFLEFPFQFSHSTISSHNIKWLSLFSSKICIIRINLSIYLRQT